MSEYFNVAKDTLKRYTIVLSISLYLFALVVGVFVIYHQQFSSANRIVSELSNTSFQIQSSADLASFLTHEDIVAASYIVSSSNQLGYQSQQSALLKASYSRIINANSSLTLVFIHPVIVLTWSWIFLFVSIVWLVLTLILYGRIRHSIRAKMSEISYLENWAYLSRISSDSSIELVENKGSISMAIRNLQQRLTEAEQRGGKVDQYIRRRALLDSETGIGNREFFNNRLEAMLAEADDDTRGSVMFIQFKELEVVFSLYGHQQALSLLENCIEQLKTRLIELPKHYFIARRGDYDVALLIPGLFVDETEKLAEKLISAVSKVQLPIGANSDEFCHIGISYFYRQNKPYQIMAEADMALRSAQLQGPSQWFMYDPGEVANESAKGSLRWRTFLNWALENNAFEVYFQSVVSVNTHEVLHFEALTKVKDKQGKLISARVFWPMAKKCGLSFKVDLLVLKRVCHLLSTKKKHFQKCSLNLSVDALLAPDFISKASAVLQKYPDVASRLIVEISEYHLVSNLNELKPVLAQLNRMGIQLLTDKVGQFVVGVQYLKNSHIDMMKLHRAIVRKIHEKPENQIFVQSIKAMADDANVFMYALGVETEEEWQTLIRLGVDGGQGHYFTEPQTLEQASGQN